MIDTRIDPNCEEKTGLNKEWRDSADLGIVVSEYRTSERGPRIAEFRISLSLPLFPLLVLFLRPSERQSERNSRI